jgi:ABC-type Fe3+-hydroxamate transport system substrate-binding protein
MSFYIDQLEREIEIIQTPKRIVSLVPSQTELLFDLGLEEEVIGITKFCIHPQNWFRTKTRIGGTKQLHVEKIRELQPDLIIANKEENVKEQIEELAKDFPVWISDVNNLPEALEMIAAVGEMTNTKERAETIISQIRANFSALVSNPSTKQKQEPKQPRQLRTAYLIWKDPYMTVGGDSFISNMLKCAGFENIFAHQTRYPEIKISELQHMDCELLLLSSEPFPFKQKHAGELQKQLPATKIILVDGEMFSWYGSRLIKAPAYFQQLQQQIQALSLF